MKSTRGKIHDYLGMTLDCSDAVKLKVGMRDCVHSVEKEWTRAIKRKKPWNGNLLKVEKNSKHLSEEVAKSCHRFIMKNMFSYERCCSNIEIDVSFLSGRVREQTEQDCWQTKFRVNRSETLLGCVFKVCASSTWECAEMSCSFVHLLFVVVACRCAEVRMTHDMFFGVR